jgi:lysozyme
VPGLLKFKTTLSLLQAGDRAGAAAQALKSLWAKQTPNRAKRVTDLIRGT